jgi:formate hydrogenlyase subunit 3/multisubunit Na+/H+ antiporter MnhD subunit
MSLFAFGLAGVSLIGLPPSGGFLAKWLLLSAAVATGQWWWAAVLMVGGLLTTGYVALVVARALASGGAPPVLRTAVPRHREAAALTLAIVSMLLGLAAFSDVDLLGVGR